jgi:hypothetical protein
MSQFTLTINFTSAGITTLDNASMSVAMLQAAPDSNYQIVALLAKPQQNMQITWQDSTSVYTSNYPIKPYTTLQINNSRSATTGKSYSYDGSQISYEGQGSQGSVQLSNRDASTTITAGLANKFTLNSVAQALAILTAEPLLYNGLGTFPISSSFYLTALLSCPNVGYVIPAGAIPNTRVETNSIAAQPELLLDFSTIPTQTVRFDDVNNQFVPYS